MISPFPFSPQPLGAAPCPPWFFFFIFLYSPQPCLTDDASLLFVNPLGSLTMEFFGAEPYLPPQPPPLGKTPPPNQLTGTPPVFVISGNPECDRRAVCGFPSFRLGRPGFFFHSFFPYRGRVHSKWWASSFFFRNVSAPFLSRSAGPFFPPSPAGVPSLPSCLKAFGTFFSPR